MNDVQVAVAAARAAAEVLLPLRDGDLRDGALGDAGDAAAQRTISAVLAAHRPGDAVLSEEAADDPARLTADRVWVVDPLDGTKEYRAGDRHDWAVHVALWERAAGDLTVGAVGLPALDEVLTTDPAPAVPPVPDGPLRVAVSRSRAPEVARVAAAALDAVLVPLGSAGYKTLAVVRGEADAYVHAGGMHQWDSAAPVAVARAAGLWTSRLDGSPLVYNGPGTWLPDLVVCRPELAERVLAAVR
ncbi:inositol monophosphatase family protein [Klenkia brasiliensis]|uniref:3'(2'),5-bisphosphonucleoside 3'(2')-phosphohydrolase n=1 Tax=Klenkia brasiliensis TaxID=333142 RepID=A0A1G7QPQ6_9ACTN|nr:inositol monophosphatase family protein [Klenkia brasiliensis]SDG00505.1 3'(2'),5'-bisphosphate nucleotidase [Klenkia brasiliensis]